VVTEGHYDASFETEEPPPNDHHHVAVDHQLFPLSSADHRQDNKMAAGMTKLNNGAVSSNSNNNGTRHMSVMAGVGLPRTSSGPMSTTTIGNSIPEQYGYNNLSPATAHNFSVSTVGGNGGLPLKEAMSAEAGIATQRPTTILNNMLGLRTKTPGSSAAATATVTTTSGVGRGVGGAGRPATGRLTLSPHSAQTVPTHISRLGHHQQPYGQVFSCCGGGGVLAKDDSKKSGHESLPAGGVWCLQLVYCSRIFGLSFCHSSSSVFFRKLTNHPVQGVPLLVVYMKVLLVSSYFSFY
jgi:hypothetical protein